MMRWLMLLLNICPTLALADSSTLGRLFFSPSERAQFEQSDALRPAHPSPSELRKFEVNGIVQRGDGKGTVWLNRLPIQEDSREGDVQIGNLRQDSDRVRLEMPQRQITIRPGQHLDIGTGKAAEKIWVQQTGATR